MGGAAVTAKGRDAGLVRSLTWAAYALLVLLTVALRSSGLSEMLRIQLSDALLYLVPIALTLLGALVLSFRTSGGESRLWFLIASLSFLILVSEAYFTWYLTTVDPRGPTIPSPYQLLQLAAVFLGAWVVIGFTDFGPGPTRSVVRFGLDVLGGMILLAVCCYWFLLLPLFRAAPGESWQGAAVSALFPVVGLTIVAFMSVAAASGRTYRWRSWERLIAAAFLLYGAAMIITPVVYLQWRAPGGSESSVWSSAVLGFGYYVLFMSTIYRATASRDEAGVEPWFFPRLGPKWFPTAYPIMLAAALPFVGVGALEIGSDPAGAPVALAAVGIAVVLVVRSWLRSSEAGLHRIAADTDSATGTFNYRYLRHRLESDLVYAKETDAPLGVITLGVEGLRAISDVGGPGEHDRVVKNIVAAIRDAAEGDSSLCRTRSDAFVVIARGLDSSAVLALAGQLLLAARDAALSLGVHASFSAGVAMFPEHGDTVDLLLARSGAAQAVSASADEPDPTYYDPDRATELGHASAASIARAHSRRATTRVLAAAVDARDPETRRHSENVADLASALALMLDLPAERSQMLDLAARMHDVGKIGIPDVVLHASGELTDEQRELVEQHTVLGERILAAARLVEITPAVRHHHERWDGGGYPDGLAGTDIPLEARILSVCDAYESMTRPRSYGGNLSVDEAVAEISRCSGTQFDPDVAAPFCRMIRQVHGMSPRDRAGRGVEREPGGAASPGF